MWRCMSHPPAAVFQARLLDNQEGANTERYVFEKLLRTCFHRPPFCHRHYSNHGDINHGKSVQGGVIVWYTSSYKVPWYILAATKTRITLLLPAVCDQREHPAGRVGPCCARRVPYDSLHCTGITRTATIVVYHPPTIVAVALYYNRVAFFPAIKLIKLREG